MRIRVFGASDDLIEIDGDVREEICQFDANGYLAFSDGTILRIYYGHDGNWVVYPHELGAFVEHEDQLPVSPSCDYSEETVLLFDDAYAPEWVVYFEKKNIVGLRKNK